MSAYTEFLQNPEHKVAHICRVSYIRGGEGFGELLYFEPSNSKWYRPCYLEHREECGCYGDLFFPGEANVKIVKIEIVTKYKGKGARLA